MIDLSEYEEVILDYFERQIYRAQYTRNRMEEETINNLLGAMRLHLRDKQKLFEMVREQYHIQQKSKYDFPSGFTPQTIPNNTLKAGDAKHNPRSKPKEEKVISEPKEAVIDEPKKDVVDEPQKAVIDEPKKAVIDEPKKAVIDEPNEDSPYVDDLEDYVDEEENRSPAFEAESAFKNSLPKFTLSPNQQITPSTQKHSDCSALKSSPNSDLKSQEIMRDKAARYRNESNMQPLTKPAQLFFIEKSESRQNDWNLLREEEMPFRQEQILSPYCSPSCRMSNHDCKSNSGYKAEKQKRILEIKREQEMKEEEEDEDEEENSSWNQFFRMQKEEDRAFDDCIDISLAHGSVHVTGVYSPRSSRHNTKTYGDRLAFNMMLIKSSNQPTELMLCNYKFNMFEGSPFDKLGYKPEHDENEEEYEEDYEEENEDEKDDYKPPKGRS